MGQTLQQVRKAGSPGAAEMGCRLRPTAKARDLYSSQASSHESLGEGPSGRGMEHKTLPCVGWESQGRRHVLAFIPPCCSLVWPEGLFPRYLLPGGGRGLGMGALSQAIS